MPKGPTKQETLQQADFGQQVAEEESDTLEAYFVETDTWHKLLEGDLDIIYGPKGSGKSALYWLLSSRESELLDRNIMLAPAENPRGAPAFQGIMADPPATETEFINLWKLYFLTLISSVFDEMGIENAHRDQLRTALAKEELVKDKLTLGRLLNRVARYVKRELRPEAVEGKVTPEGISGKIIFREPTAGQTKEGFQSVDSLLELANLALRDYSKVQLWIILDRLDVAFAENPELEQNALRALFRVYRDLSGYDLIKLKIFLRSDIWDRIAASGFREASHITRHVTIHWDPPSLLNLIVRRALHNPSITDFYTTTWADVQDSVDLQREFFDRMFPEQVDVGTNKPSTLDWVLSRTRDGSTQNAPRELIHFLNELRVNQMRRFERGEPDPDDEALFSRPAFKEALTRVSTVRLQQTLYAEYPSLRKSIEALRGQKTRQTPETLARIWKIEPKEAASFADQLVDVGFFEAQGSREAPEYWTPFLYRDALELVQGTAEV